MNNVIYPTARSVLLMAAGVPVALIVGIVWPALWTAAFGWMAFVLLLMLLDAAFAPAAARIVASLDVPHSVPVGAKVEARLGLSAKAQVEAMLDGDPHLARIGPARRMFRPGEEQRLRFAALRRGTARLPALWLRWGGPLGLVWRQKREARDEAILILPDLRPAREQGQLFLRQALPGETARTGGGTGS